MRLVALLLVLAISGTVAAGCGDKGTNADASVGDGSGVNDGYTNGDAAIDAPFFCDVVAQTGCPNGQACYNDVYGLGNDPTYYCATPGAGTEAASCTSNADCAAGYWCATPGPDKCTRYCDTAAQCSSTSPSCLRDQAMEHPFGYCACVNPPGIGTCS